jgi:hypothetical protein
MLPGLALIIAGFYELQCDTSSSIGLGFSHDRARSIAPGLFEGWRGWEPLDPHRATNAMDVAPARMPASEVTNHQIGLSGYRWWRFAAECR